MSVDPPPSPTPASRALSRLPSLTGLRFLAALAVFCFHITLTNSPIPPNDPINPFADDGLATGTAWLFGKAGYLGVSFFFVLSGFVLTWSAKPGDTRLSFWRRRMLKIFPNHLVMWVLAMVLFAAAITKPAAWILNIFLLHSFVPDAATYVSVNPPSWTLCCELLFYLSFPFLIRPIRRIAANRLWWWAGAAVAGMVVVQLITQFLIPDTPRSPITPVSTTQFWFGYIFPAPRLLEFILGILLARIVLAGRWVPISVAQAAGLTVLGYVAALFVPFLYSFTVAMILPVGALICAAATSDLRGRQTVLNGRTMQWLGDISFAFYICQGVVIFWVRPIIGPPGGFSTPVALAVILGFLAATTLAGWALYSLVEHPIMRRWARSPAAAAAAARARRESLSKVDVVREEILTEQAAAPRATE